MLRCRNHSGYLRHRLLLCPTEQVCPRSSRPPHRADDCVCCPMLSTRLSRRPWVSESIQCKSSSVRPSGCTWLSRTRRRLSASRVRCRLVGASRLCHSGSSTGTSSRVRYAARAGRRILRRILCLSGTYAGIWNTGAWRTETRAAGARLLLLVNYFDQGIVIGHEAVQLAQNAQSSL